MLKKIYKLIFLLTQMRDVKRLHYKMAKVNGEKGCVEGVISDKMAQRLKATLGKCQDVNCVHYRGKTKLPFCCEVSGYSCNEYI